MNIFHIIGLTGIVMGGLTIALVPIISVIIDIREERKAARNSGVY